MISQNGSEQGTTFWATHVLTLLITGTIFQRSLLSGGSIAQTAEVYVELSGKGGRSVDQGGDSRPRPSEFAIVPERVRAADTSRGIPKFKIVVSMVA